MPSRHGRVDGVEAVRSHEDDHVKFKFKIYTESAPEFQFLDVVEELQHVDLDRRGVARPEHTE